MEFFDKFEITGGIIPHLIGLAFFYGVIIYFDQIRKVKGETRRKSISSSIKMILFAKARIIDGKVLT